VSVVTPTDSSLFALYVHVQLRRELKNYRKMLQLRDFVSVKPKYSHSNYTPPPPFVLDDAPAEAPIRQPDESERLAAGTVCI